MLKLKPKHIEWDYKFLVFLFITAMFYFFALSKYPVVWVDEPWVSEPAWNFIKFGKFINLTFTGYYKKEMWDLICPAFHFPLIAAFKAFGLSIIAARSISVILALLTLVLVYNLIKLLRGNASSALVGAVFLACNPVFFQCARQIRSEAYVAFFAVAGFYFFMKAVQNQKWFNYFICGIFAGGSLLCHPNGLFVIFTFFIIMLFKNPKNILYYFLGVLIITIGWFLFILANFDVFKYQILDQFSERMSFAKKLIGTFLYEYKRWFYPSVAIPALAGILSVIYLIFNGDMRKKYAVLISYIIIFTALLCFVDKSKTFLYLNLIFPFFAVSVAIAYSQICGMRKVLAVTALILVLLASFVFLPYKVCKSFNADYYGLIAKIKETMPKGAVVVGMPTYWFGVEGYYNYRTYDLFYYYADKYKTSYKNAAKLIKADYVIFDNGWAGPYITPSLLNFLKEDCTPTAVFTDKYYGRGSDKVEESDNIKIYKIKKD